MSADGPLVYLIAGEASGDQLGAGLMAALKCMTDGRARFAGVGGPLMEGKGLVSLFPMHELSVMGFAEVLPRLWGLLARIRETAADVQRRDPDVIVTIDAPSFVLRVLRRLRSRRAPRLHYVAPQLWAWRPGRIRAYRPVVDRLLALLPFEPDYFRPKGMECEFVGHPSAVAALGDARAFRVRHGLTESAPLLLILPGSRAGEITRMFPVFAQAADLIRSNVPDAQVALLATPGREDDLRARAATMPRPALVVGAGERADLFAAANAALAASGTVSVELAAAGVPHLVAYRVSALTAWLVRRLVRVKHVALVNIVLGRAAIPELIQEACTPERLAATAIELMREPEAASSQRAAFRQACGLLAPEGEPPFERAARAVLAELAQRRRSMGT